MIIQSNIIRLADRIVRIGTMRNTWKIFVDNLRREIVWQTMAKVGDNIKMRSYINVCEAVNLIHLVENVVQCCVLVFLGFPVSTSEC